MNRNYFFATIIVTSLLTGCTSGHNDETPVWSDEFEGTSLDLQKWSYQTGDGCPDICGWGNNELQYYTDTRENVRIENGVLVIEARQDSAGSRGYTSGKLITKGKGDWSFGRVEVRAKLPSGRGTWPAIWMLSTDMKRWPADGEIDIMEHVGYNQGWIVGTIHTDKYNHMIGTQKTDSLFIEDASDSFHTYIMEWDKSEMSWSIDGQLYHTVSKGEDGYDGWPFDQPFYLILNVAVGGNWGGKYGVDDSIWPQRMEVDYVRIYQKQQ